MRRCIAPLSLVFLTFVSFGSDLLGCSCARGQVPYPKVPLETADIAFVGTVVEVQTHEDDEAFREFSMRRTFNDIRVDSPLKGPQRGEVVRVSSGVGGGDCGVGFEVGKQYIVFATRNPDTDQLSTSICQGSQSLIKPLAKCVSLLDSKNPLGLIWGTVSNYRRIDLTGAYVEIVGEEIEAQVPVQSVYEYGLERGEYLFENLLPGRYTMTLRLPSVLDPDPWVIRPTVDSSVPCTRTSFVPRVGGRLSVHVVDASGRAANHLRLELVNHAGSRQSIWTNDLGTIILRHQRPGTFRLRVARPDASDLQSHSYWGQRGRETAGLEIGLEVGEIVDVGEYRLPFELGPVTMRGQVLLPDGAPAREAWIAVNDEPDLSWNTSPGTRSDELGFFEFSLYRHLSYTISVSAKDEKSSVLRGRSQWKHSNQGQEILTVRLAAPIH